MKQTKRQRKGVEKRKRAVHDLRTTRLKEISSKSN